MRPSQSGRCFEERLSTFKWRLREKTKLSFALFKSLSFSQQNIKWNLYNAIHRVLPPKTGDPGPTVSASCYQDSVGINAKAPCTLEVCNFFQRSSTRHSQLCRLSACPPPRGYGQNQESSEEAPVCKFHSCTVIKAHYYRVWWVQSLHVSYKEHRDVGTANARNKIRGTQPIWEWDTYHSRTSWGSVLQNSCGFLAKASWFITTKN